MSGSFFSNLSSRYGYKQILWVGIYVLFLVQAVRVCISAFLPKTFDYFGWGGLSDYYINYQGGFVRRGLMGEVLYFLAGHFPIDVHLLIAAIAFVCFSFLCFFFVKSFCKKGYALYILPLCFFLGMFRGNTKDYLLILVFILNLLIYKSHWRMATKFVLVNTLSVFAILIHEAFGMIALPALFLLSLDRNNMQEKNNIVRQIVFSFLFLLPSVLSMLLVIHAHGDPEMAQSIWDSWRSVLHIQHPEQVASGSAIGAIGWTGAFAFQYHIHLNFLTVSYGVPSLLGWPVSFILIYYVLINYLSFFKKGDAHYTQEHRTGLSVILLFQFACLLPLFLVFSCDYGRLCFFWVTSSFVLFLLIPQNVIQRLAPAFFIRCANRINHCLSAVLRPSKMLVAVLMLFIGISPDQFSMGMVMKASVVYNVYAVLRDSILFLYGCVGAF